MMVRFDPSEWEWANMLVERYHRPDRSAVAIISGIGGDGVVG
jgi:hypothetical protein